MGLTIMLMIVVPIMGLCYAIDLYWKIRGFFKNRSKNKRSYK